MTEMLLHGNRGGLELNPFAPVLRTLSPDGLLPEIIEYTTILGSSRAILPRAEIAAIRAAPVVLVLHGRGGGAKPAGVVML